MITFHKHHFIESVTRPGVIFCTCGKIKKLPCQHEWEEVEEIYNSPTRDTSGAIVSFSSKNIRLSCKNCGDTKFIHM